MITPGGEETFVSKMVDESITLGKRCRHVPFSIISYLPVREPFSQMVYLHGWQASHLSRLSLRSSALTQYALKCLAPTRFTLSHNRAL
jgi:23S rRNA A1618 N6-methylase RlmF